MMRGKKTAFGAMLILLLGMVGVGEAQEVGKVVSAIGSVEVVRKETGNREGLAVNAAIFLNDTISTGSDGRAKVLLHDDSVLKVAPSSELLVSEMVAGANGDHSTVVNLLKGRLRSVIGKKLGPQASFEVHTDVAVAGVRGTDFEVVAGEGGATAIRCFEGSVVVFNMTAGTAETVVLTPNTYTTLSPGQAPTPPAPIEPGESLGEAAGGGDGQLREATTEEIEALLEAADANLIDLYNALELGEGTGAGQFVFNTLGLDGEYVYVPTEELLPLIEVLIEEQLGGDAAGGQTDTITSPQLPGQELQFDITIPLP